jgi:hypothetical protein
VSLFTEGSGGWAARSDEPQLDAAVYAQASSAWAAEFRPVVGAQDRGRPTQQRQPDDRHALKTLRTAALDTRRLRAGRRSERVSHRTVPSDGAVPRLQSPQGVASPRMSARNARRRLPGPEVLGRFVCRGEKAIAPIMRRRGEHDDMESPAVGLRAVYVFDGLSRDSDRENRVASR